MGRYSNKNFGQNLRSDSYKRVFSLARKTDKKSWKYKYENWAKNGKKWVNIRIKLGQILGFDGKTCREI